MATGSGNEAEQKIVVNHVAQVSFVFEHYDPAKSTFTRWLDRLEETFNTFDVPENSRKSRLIYYMGQDIYNKLCDKISPEKPQDKTYKEITEILEKHYNPKPLEIVETYKFRLRVQNENEKVQDFLISLRKLAVNCGFKEHLQRALRDQFTFGLRDKRILHRLLEEKDLTVDKALEIAIGMELSSDGTTMINKKPSNNSAAASEVHAVHHASSTKSSKNKKKAKNFAENKSTQCYRCGASSHLANACKFKDVSCRYCKILGHLEKMCLKKKNENVSKKSDSNNGKSSHTTNYIEKLDVEEIFHVRTQDFKSKFTIELRVEDCKVKFEVDTGSAVSILNDEDRKKFFNNFTLQATDTKLISYCNTEISVRGFITIKVFYRNLQKNLKLYIVQGSRLPILGREWICRLGLDLNNLYELSVNFVDKPSLNVLGEIEKFKVKYAKVFDGSLKEGIQNYKAKIQLKPDAKPVFQKYRQVPFAIKPLVEKELNALVESGVLVKVDHSEWATPIVPILKGKGKVRICGDYKTTLNPRILIDSHPLPTLDELAEEMVDGEKYTKLDLFKAYYQMTIDENTQNLLTLSTHLGLFRPTRIVNGIASGPAVWQRFIEMVLCGIPGVKALSDDVRVTGKTAAEHLQNLERVLQRFEKYNLKLNLEKCEFFQDEIEYCGVIISKNGMRKIRDKCEAIEEMPFPKNKDEVRSFIGFVNYYGRFIKDLSSKLYPITNLLKDGVKFKFDKRCEKAFKQIKEEVQSERILVHYDPKLPLVMATDASPVGVSAVLSHRFPDGTERPIKYASQTLSPTQQNYSQIDREAYGVIFGVKKFYRFLFGRHFILQVDNRPLSQIFSPSKSLPTLATTRMQHYAIFLQSYDYEVEWRNSKSHANADCLSRLPIPVTSGFDLDVCDVFEINQIETLPLKVADLKEVTMRDKSVKVLIHGLSTGQIVNYQDRFGIDQTEFTLQSGCLMRGIRVYVPESLRKRVLNELHSTHFGVVRMKSLARGYCWWPGIDKDIEELAKDCRSCALFKPNPEKVPIHTWEAVHEPFQRVHVDFAGEFMGRYFFVLVDAYTKWPEVIEMKTITAGATITVCHDIFTHFGFPSMIVSDNGPQFTSTEFQEYCARYGITHRTGAPYHPATNGQAERMIQTVKNKLKTLVEEHRDTSKLKLELGNILLDYRKTIHPATSKSPSQLFLGRQIRSRLDLLKPANEIRDTPELKKSFSVGEKVQVRDYFDNKVKWKFGTILDKIGKLLYSVELEDGRTWRRHVDQIRSFGSTNAPKENEKIEENDYYGGSYSGYKSNSQNDSLNNDPLIELENDNTVNSNGNDSQSTRIEGESETQNETNIESGNDNAPSTSSSLRRSNRPSKPVERLTYS